MTKLNLNLTYIYCLCKLIAQAIHYQVFSQIESSAYIWYNKLLLLLKTKQWPPFVLSRQQLTNRTPNYFKSKTLLKLFGQINLDQSSTTSSIFFDNNHANNKIRLFYYFDELVWHFQAKTVVNKQPYHLVVIQDLP